MVQQDIRWIQRFSNYRKALAKLSQAMAIMSEQLAFNDGVDELLQEGMIQRFEYTHELAWKVMKDYAEYQGYTYMGCAQGNMIDDKTGEKRPY